MIRVWWHGECDDEPLLLAVEPGTKQLVTVQLLVDAEHDDQATTLVGDLLRRAESPRAGGPIIDWRFVSQTPYRLAAEYEEGDAFSPANSAATGTDKPTWYCKLCYGTFWTDPAERIISRCPYCGGRSLERLSPFAVLNSPVVAPPPAGLEVSETNEKEGWTTS